MRNVLLQILLLAMLASPVQAATPPPTLAVSQRDGRLVYNTSKDGDRVPDFSHCGYMGGGVPIPDVHIRIVVPAIEGDSTDRIQRAIDHVASLPPDDRGIRGAVLLGKGRHKVHGGLLISGSGVILRGHAAGDGGTTLFAAGHDRRTLIRIAGKDDRSIDSDSIAIADDYVPVHATRIKIRSGHNLKVGDTILIRRPSTADWIKTLGMHNLGGDRHGFSWRSGSRDIVWDRVVTRASGDEITIDAPITTALDSKFGGARISKYTWPGRITQVGVENLRCESGFDPANPKDENHSWMAITMENVNGAWVRQVNVAHFAGSAVSIWDSKRITVQDCKSLAPVSEIGGHRRHSFFTNGQLVLFDRCYSENGRHDFSVGFCAAGPNAFVQCDAINALADSGPIDSWAGGILYDNVRIDGNAISLHDRRYQSQGAGWSAANSMLWQCHAAVINLFSPPTATNWAQGCWATFNGDGEWAESNESVKPDSLYYAQLAERLGPDAVNRNDFMDIPSEASSSPSVEQAAALVRASTEPAPQLSTWIDQAAKRHPIPTDQSQAKSVDDLPRAERKKSSPSRFPVAISNGWITSNGRILTGGRENIMWWRGGTRPDDIAQARTNPTRFVPGRIGRAFTQDLDQLTDDMRQRNNVALEFHYGLWYDRRRDDHERVRRLDGDVWPPFYEQPFARSGQGIAWDGLSKYDLTRYNPWYWDRLKTFADLAETKGQLLIHNHYFQHNILEAGAHYADFPWRTANNINDTGFPEPPPYAGDKRVFMAEQFYDVSHPTRRELHRKYIRKCLDSFADNTNVIHLTSAEYTGPLHFVQFWLDTIAEWKKETGSKTLIVGLSATKDVQDAILSDPTRAPLVNLIDIRYWWYEADGTAYAPKSAQNLAPRQHARLLKPKPSSPEQVTRAVREYRQKYPDKAVIYSADGGEKMGNAVLLGGGSLPNVALDPELAAFVAKTKPDSDGLIDSDGARLLLKNGQLAVRTPGS